MSSKTQTNATKEEATPALVPKLRFPEFRNLDDWRPETMSGVATVVMGSSPKSECYNESQDGLPLLQGNADIKNRLSAPRIFTSEITKECQVGDILMSVRAPVGSIAKSIYHACIGRGIAAIHAKQPNCQEFLYQWLLSYEPRWVNISQGGTFDAINSDDLKHVGLITPKPAEQQKIAECLSSVDELMAAQARKVDALKTHKKGLMQQLFPREGETQPRLRFPEFQNAGDWEEYSLGQLIEIASGQVDPKQSPYCDLPQIGSENIASHSGKLVNVKSAGEKGVISGNYAFDENDILYSKIRPALNKVAAPSFKGICSADIYPIRPAGGSLLRGYLFYLLLSQDFLDHAIRNSERGKIPKINRDALDCYKALIPLPAEQQRIAECLTTLDALIAAQSQKHEALKTHKKGLMQQLFPAPTEQAHTSEGQRPGLFPSPEEVEG